MDKLENIVRKLVNFFKLLEFCFSTDLKSCFSIASAYISAVSVVDGISKIEASDDQASNGDFYVNENYTNVSVSYILNHVLWNCRNHSLSKNYYKILYVSMLISLIFVLIWTMKHNSLKKMRTSAFLSAFMIRVSFFILLTSYNISIWECLRGPSEIVYIQDSSTAELHVSETILCYQLYGSVISLCFTVFGIAFAAISIKYKSEELKNEFYTEYIKESDDHYSSLTITKTGSIKLGDVAKHSKSKIIKLSILE